MKTFTIPVLFFFLLAGCASNPAQPVQVKNAWARPALSGQTSAVYFIIVNPKVTTEQLLGASTSAAALTELHKSEHSADDVMSMQPQSSIEIPAKGQVAFEPGGLHVMLTDLKQDLKSGDTLELLLRFKNSGEITLQVPVQDNP
jgi:hypothetical protein